MLSNKNVFLLSATCIWSHINMKTCDYYLWYSTSRYSEVFYKDVKLWWTSFYVFIFCGTVKVLQDYSSKQHKFSLPLDVCDEMLKSSCSLNLQRSKLTALQLPCSASLCTIDQGRRTTDYNTLCGRFKAFPNWTASAGILVTKAMGDVTTEHIPTRSSARWHYPQP